MGLGPGLELATFLSFSLYFFRPSSGGIRKGDPLASPIPAPGNSAAVSPLLGFNIYL